MRRVRRLSRRGCCGGRRNGPVDVSFRRSITHGDNLTAHALVTDTDPAKRLVKLDVYLANDKGERPLQVRAP